MPLKKFYKAGLFFLSLVLLLYAYQWFIGFGLKHNKNVKASYAASQEINAQLLVLGPCEPLWMADPETIEKYTSLSAYNLANAHSDFADNYLHLYLYLKKSISPTYLLLYVTPESFDTNYNTFYSYRFAPFLDDIIVADVVKDCDHTYYDLKDIPAMQYVYYNHQSFFNALTGWKHYFTGRKYPYHMMGFEPPAEIAWDNHYDNLKLKYPNGYYFSWSGKREKYLDKILSLCREKGIKVILYESPVLKETADNQPNRTEFIKSIERIASNAGIPFFSFQNVSWAGDRKHFISPMITTLKGSYEFSDTLGAFLRKYFDEEKVKKVLAN